MATLGELNPIEIYDLKKKYFEQVQDITFKNINIKVRPMPSDIPVMDKHYYDVHSDIFTIMFKNSGNILQKQVDNTLIFLIDNNTRYFAGIKIVGMNAQNIKSVSLTIEKKVEDYLNEMKNRLASIKKEDLLKALTDLNMNDRRAGFIKELVEKELAVRTA